MKTKLTAVLPLPKQTGKLNLGERDEGDASNSEADKLSMRDLFIMYRYTWQVQNMCFYFKYHI